jgi:hypothetical protein
MDKRLRKARTDHNWVEMDGFQDSEGNWRYFKNRERVEFKENGKLVRRRVRVVESSYDIYCHCPETIRVSKAYVTVHGMRVRVTQAPAMRLV